ncbi:MAG: hypothetical protein H7274_02720 [Rhodoferax sp.]|nr:hypothetical protein [Rhodoferax sp.]
MSKTEMQRATAAFVPDETTFAVRLNLETLKSFGCTYESGDENQLKHLEKIITSVKSSIATERQTFEPRFAIYASLADGDQITIVIHKSNSKFYAEIIQSATSQKIHTLIDSSLASEIYSLVRNFKLTPGGNLDSSNCAEFMEKISLE